MNEEGRVWNTREVLLLISATVAAVSFVWGISLNLTRVDGEIFQSITTLTVTQRDNVDRVKRLEMDVQVLKLQDARREALEKSIQAIEGQQRELLDHLLRHEDEFKKRYPPLGRKSSLPDRWEPETSLGNHDG